MASMPLTETEVTVGVDTHRDTHVAAALDQMGHTLGMIEVGAEAAGYRRLELFAGSFGRVKAFGVEGTGSYGAGLARYLNDRGHRVVEVDRPDRRLRRKNGKPDPIDAIAAALAVLSARANTVPKARNGQVEALRALSLARRSAVRARTQALNQLRCLVTTAPEPVRARLRGLTLTPLLRTCAGFRVSESTSPEGSTRYTLRSLSRRIAFLDAELADLESRLESIVAKACPELLGLYGVGATTAASLLLAAGDNPERVRSEASFAHLCGAAPVPASSGLTVRHRLDRGGNRQANNALWRIVLVRMSSEERTRIYVARRTAEGLSKREIVRCLKRYVAREVYHCLISSPALTSQ